jgi:pilus assembly protein TadC
MAAKATTTIRIGIILRGIFLAVGISFLTGTVKLVTLGWLPTVDRTLASVFPCDVTTRGAGDVQVNRVSAGLLVLSGTGALLALAPAGRYDPGWEG